jgi:SOS-response transcriptional repressor LexA/DNA-binding XRE family transcriptional regulator
VNRGKNLSRPNQKRPELPDWAKSILKLRQRLGLSQTELGSRLHYSAMAISRWETGKQEPTSQCYIQLGNLAGEPDCWLFWNRAGLTDADLQNIFPGPKAQARLVTSNDFDAVRAGGGAAVVMDDLPRPPVVAIPLTGLHAGALGEPGSPQGMLQDSPPEEMIAAPALWCENPRETICLRVKGSSMAPLIENGDIVAVDTSMTDPEDLNGKITVAWHRQSGLALARLIVSEGVQLLESENRHYLPIRIEKDRQWRIMGKVLWWIRKAP